LGRLKGTKVLHTFCFIPFFLTLVSYPCIIRLFHTLAACPCHIPLLLTPAAYQLWAVGGRVLGRSTARRTSARTARRRAASSRADSRMGKAKRGKGGGKGDTFSRAALGVAPLGCPPPCFTCCFFLCLPGSRRWRARPRSGWQRRAGHHHGQITSEN
jgi:hypothetical protein